MHVCNPKNLSTSKDLTKTDDASMRQQLLLTRFDTKFELLRKQIVYTLFLSQLSNLHIKSMHNKKDNILLLIKFKTF